MFSDHSWIHGVWKPSISYLYLGYRRTLYLSFILGVQENPLIYIFQYQVYIPIRNGNKLLHGRNYTVILNENILLQVLEYFSIWSGIICHMEWNYLPYGMELFAIRNGIICHMEWNYTVIDIDLLRWTLSDIDLIYWD